MKGVSGSSLLKANLIFIPSLMNLKVSSGEIFPNSMTRRSYAARTDTALGNISRDYSVRTEEIEKFNYIVASSSASSAVAGSNLNGMVGSFGCSLRRGWYNVKRQKGKDLATLLVNKYS